jgi:putative Mn2+ efflux pump MntP
VFLEAIRIAFVFAVFQGIMPALGWLGGVSVEKYVAPVNHWIALSLLLIVGCKMIFDAFSHNKKELIDANKWKIIFTAAFATSIDAFIVGIPLAFTNSNIFIVAPFIGLCTGITAMLGMLIGKKIAGILGNKVQIVGGLIIIGLGIKIFIEHQIP